MNRSIQKPRGSAFRGLLLLLLLLGALGVGLVLFFRATSSPQNAAAAPIVTIEELPDSKNESSGLSITPTNEVAPAEPTATSVPKIIPSPFGPDLPNGQQPRDPFLGASPSEPFSVDALTPEEIRKLRNQKMESVSGRVITTEGEPAAGANISIVGTDDFSLSLVADPSGNFKTDLPPGTFTFSARGALDFASIDPEIKIVSVSLGRTPPLVELVISPTEFVEGLVKDTEGNPLPGVEILLQESIQNYGGLGNRTVNRLESDATGAFRIEGIGQGGMVPKILFQKEGYQTLSRSNVSELDSPLEIILSKATGLQVYVVWEASNEPVTRFHYRLLREGFNSFEIETNHQGTEIYSEDGRIEIQELAVGSYRIEANVVDESGTILPIRDAVLFKVAAGTPSQVLRLEMRGGATIRGTVVEKATSQPLENAVVEILPPFGGYRSDSPLMNLNLSDVTGASGTFLFEGIPPGRYSITASLPGYSHPIPVDFDLQMGDTEPLTIAMVPAETLLSCTVTGEDGKPLEGQTVRLELTANDTGELLERTALTNTRGVAEFKDLVEGKGTLFLEAEDKLHSSGVETIEGITSHYSFTLSEWIMLSGTVTLNGEIPKQNLYLALHNDRNIFGEETQVINGKYNLRVRAGSYKPELAGVNGMGETFELSSKAGKTQTKNFDFTFSECTVVAVFPEGEKFVPGKLVLLPEEGPFISGFERYNLDSESARLGRLVPGSYRLTFESNDGTWSADSGLIVVKGDTPTEFILEVEKNSETHLLAKWSPENFPLSGNLMRFNITDRINSNEPIIVTFDYEKGRHALNIFTVRLLENGAVVSEDRHKGWAGYDRVATTYRVQENDYSRGVTYELEMEVAPNGGNDSYGSIYLQH
ncbi:MAG: carboxypeptidase-like regulatory domain-containing protein [Candidatus Sumerlaeia bacterium]|nr:carboxypeptidase-like regulatory domain-containing protein [Candidatus Sumerlaeia bacterium]